jgi:hypothetical protein
MNNDDEDNQPFFNEDSSNPDKIFVEIPPEHNYPYHQKIPSGYDPMGEIYLRGRAFRGMSGGRAPWWVLITGWIIFGGFGLMLISLAIASSSFAPIFPLAFVSIFIVILVRGTAAKLSLSKQRRR